MQGAGQAGVRDADAPGQRVGELAPGPGVEQQRRGDARNARGHHVAHEDGVVAARVAVAHPAVDPGGGVGQDRAAGRAGQPVSLRETVGHLGFHSGEPAAEADVVAAEHVDGEHAVAVQQFMGAQPPVDADQHQGRIQADAAEGTRRHAVAAGRAGCGDYPDTARPAGQYLPKGAPVHGGCHRHPRSRRVSREFPQWNVVTKSVTTGPKGCQ